MAYEQVDDLLKMGANEELGLGHNNYTSLVSNSHENLTLSLYLPNKNYRDNVDLPNLNLKQLKKIISEANSVANNLGHLSNESPISQFLKFLKETN